MKMDLVLLIFSWLFIVCVAYDGESLECNINDVKSTLPASEIRQSTKYLLYDVNPGEGFNLRRDVYIRVANLVRTLRQKGDDWILVLPPWGPLYHWKSLHYEEPYLQMKLPWSTFFNIESLNKFIPVIELTEFMKNVDFIDVVYSLQYYADTFDEGNSWVDKYDLSNCLTKPLYSFKNDGSVHGWFWGYNENIIAKNFSCLSLQGHINTLAPLLLSSNHKSVMLERAEIMLHDGYGDSIYWMARRSMRYSPKLIHIGDIFRKQYLNSTDLADGTELPDDWMQTKKSKTRGIGGPYIGVHLRRGDFARGRPQTVPSFKNAARQINKIIDELKVSLVYISTDATEKEFNELQKWLPSAIRFVPTAQELYDLLDGGIAIIDQWICAHARYFVGTHESTFSFRIQEDREILGFHADTTFNRLCGDSEGDQCEQPTRWQIEF